MAIGELIAGVGDVVSKGASAGYGIFSGERAYYAGRSDTTFSKNLAMWNALQQQKEFDYAKDLQKEMFRREDNAVQRRAADLEKAGLSKTLAAGSGAGAGSVVSTHLSNVGNPTSNTPHSSVSFDFNFLEMLKQIEEIKAQKEQVDLIKAQKERIGAEKKSVDLDNDIKSYDFERVKKGFGMNKSHGLALDTYYLLNNWFQDNAVEPVANAIDKTVDSVKGGYNAYVNAVDSGLKRGKSALQSFREHFPRFYIEDGSLVIEEPKKKWFRNKKRG